MRGASASRSVGQAEPAIVAYGPATYATCACAEQEEGSGQRCPFRLFGPAQFVTAPPSFPPPRLPVGRDAQKAEGQGEGPARAAQT